MKLYQLFKSVPTDAFNAQLLQCFGLSGFDDASEFSKATLRERDSTAQVRGEGLGCGGMLGSP